MNPRPFLRSAAFDYRSTARQVKNRNGVWRSAFGVSRSAFAGCPSTALERFSEVAGTRDVSSIVIMAKMVNRGGDTPNAKRLVRENLRKKLAGAVCLRILKKGLFWPVFDDFTTVHENNSIGDSFGKTHLMGDH